jgi:hypothetical protein
MTPSFCIGEGRLYMGFVTTDGKLFGLIHDLLFRWVTGGLRSGMLLPRRVAAGLRSGLLR